ncbi:RHS repeat-associated core domain-containing protein [Photobacterium sp. 53610]|uniref:RHS repeat-associated core domain-containing protein n=1 Tax=Photobacterium sp. 53610 TaxID=3102789 RepID=UPI002ED8EEDD
MTDGYINRQKVKSLTTISCFFLGMLGGLVPAKAIALTSGDEKTLVLSGEYQTSGGEASYSLPVAVAPGRAGQQPNLSFEYRSNSGNGLLGVGWQLKGLSAIYRCGKNRAIDGVWGGVNFDSNDQYCLDGERLIAISGKPGGDQTEYRTHINDYRKIISVGKQGNGPAYFKVWSKTGQLFEYGVTADSRVELSGKKEVYKWALNKSVDKTRANPIDYIYAEDNKGGTHRLTQVSYEGGSVVINYEGRSDKTFSYLKGSRLNQAHRIQSVVARGGSRNSTQQEYTTYQLKYASSEGTQRSLLTKIEQCASGICSTPVTFTWQSRSKPEFASTKTIFSSDTKKLKFYDVERDGHVEVFALGGNLKSVVRNSDARSTSALSTQRIDKVSKALCQDFSVADWNGNNKPFAKLFCAWSGGDIWASMFYATQGKMLSYPAGGGKFNPYFDHNVDGFSWASSSTYPLDKKGNGQYSLTKTCQNCVYYDFDSDGLNNEYLKYNSGKYEYYRSDKKVSEFGAGGKIVEVSDFNGDGYLDVIMGTEKWNNNTNNFGNVTYSLKVYLFTGNGFNLSDTLTIPEHGRVKTEDYICISGNRKDKYCRRYIKSFQPKKVAIADLNSDGFSEVIYHATAYLNQSGRFRNNNKRSSNFSAIAENVEVVDVNSDGWPDNVANRTIKRSIPFAQDKIKKIEEYGVDYTIVYKPASDISVLKQKNYFHYPVENSTPRRYLVSDVVKAPRGYEKTIYNYVYEGAKSHREGYGFLGFAKITETEVADVKTVRVTEFENTDGIKAGKVKSVAVLKDGQKVSYRQNTFVAEKKGQNYQVYAQKSEDIQYDLKDASLITRKEVITRKVDAFGNVTEENTILTGTDVNAGHFTQRVVNEYMPAGTVAQLVTDAGDRYWQASALKSTTTTLTDVTTDLTRTVTSTFTYTSHGLLGSSTTTASSYEASSATGGAGKSLTKLFSYDNWGNLIRESVSGTDVPVRETETVYDSQGRFADRLQNALGHETKVTYSNDGVLTSTTSPQGRTQGYVYDAFNRLKTETLPGTGNTVAYAYQLNEDCAYRTAKTVACTVTKAAAGGEVVIQYDYVGREIRRLHRAFNGQWVVVDTTWDRNGRKVKVTRPQFLSKRTPAPFVTIDYDALNREVKKSEPASQGGRAVFATTYAGLKTTVTDARGYEHSTVQNLLGHILQKIEPEGASQRYTYYPDGLLRTTTDAQGNETRVRYDNLGHRSMLDDPDLGQWTYINNALGEQIVQKDANGIVTTTEYDVLGRKIQQTGGGKTSSWVYDTRSIGMLSSSEGYGKRTDYYYNTAGLTEEVAVQTGGEKFSTYYFYDAYERIRREVRTNGVDSSAAGLVNRLNDKDNPLDRLAVEYIYNPYGYMSAVRSPKTYADKVFTSASFREEIRELLKQAKAQASQYLVTAEKYAAREAFFQEKAAEYQKKTLNIHHLDASSAALLGDGYRFKQWCDSQGQCYLRPATWVLLHNEVSIPLDITLGDAVYQLETKLAGISDGKRNYDASVHTFSKAEFDKLPLTASHDFLLADYDDNGQKDLMSNQDIYVAQADTETREALLFTAEDLSEAARISGQHYKFYVDLANDLIALSERVADLTGVYCTYANQMGGQQIQYAQSNQCTNTDQLGQADHLNTILTQSELEASANNPAFIYYWQRRDTDAFDHTLSETLGNGLVNTYNHNPATGRPDFITTHRANTLFHSALPGATGKGRNVRFLHYQYDNHNNVVYRNNSELGITDSYTYDGLDRVISNRVVLDTPDRHGPNNPDFAGPFDFTYDKLGNITGKTDVGRYNYDQKNAGPHAVTQANGLTYQYDGVGNMVRAVAGSATVPERTVDWSAFNKPVKITRDHHTVAFVYDADHQRYLKTSSDGKQTFYFGNFYERVTDTKTGKVEHQHYIYADGKLIALNTQVKNAENQLEDKQVRYLHYDALNSVDMITDGYGEIVTRRSYDVWGRMRAVQWQEKANPQVVVQDTVTNRGYTGHEHIEEVGLIHMNGRVYNQELGRFLSPDLFVQSPYISNGFNRYSFVINNPMKYIDPTGYLFTSNGMDVGGGRDPLGRGEPDGPDRDAKDRGPQGPRGTGHNGKDPDHYGRRTDLNSTAMITSSGFAVELHYDENGFVNPSLTNSQFVDGWSYGSAMTHSFKVKPEALRANNIIYSATTGYNYNGLMNLDWSALARAWHSLAPCDQELDGWSQASNNLSLISGDMAYTAAVAGQVHMAAFAGAVSLGAGASGIVIDLARGKIISAGENTVATSTAEMMNRVSGYVSDRLPAGVRTPFKVISGGLERAYSHYVSLDSYYD